MSVQDAETRRGKQMQPVDNSLTSVSAAHCACKSLICMDMDAMTIMLNSTVFVKNQQVRTISA